jgi:ethanolamine ammonia-lyase large subunit
MNNFVFSQDPLLFQSVLPRQINNTPNDANLRQEYETIMAQYQALQQKTTPQTTTNNQNKDYLGELDTITREIDEDIAETLNADIEYIKLNGELQYLIQEEVIKNIKWKINSNPDAVSKMERLKDIITSAKKEKTDENNRNLMELNDYIKNYSDLTFNEYKQLKNKK